MKLKNKLILFYSIASLVTMACTGAAVLLGLERLGTRTIEKQLIDQAGLAEIYISQIHTIQDWPGQLSRKTAGDVIGKLGLIMGHVRLYGNRLELLAATKTGLGEGLSEEDNHKILTAAQKGDFAYLTRKNTVYFASPVIQDGITLCILEIIYPISFFGNLISGVVTLFVAGAVLFIAIMTVLSITIAGRLTKPIHDLARAAESYANRDFRPVEIKSSDELSSLGRSFNSMGAQLQDYIRRQKQFVSNVSHELRTPLTAIIGYSEILAREVDDRPDLQKAVSHLNHESNRLARLVDEVLTLSRIDSGAESFSFARVDLSGLILETTESMQMRAEKYGISVKTGIEPGITILGDREKLAQVMVNLLDNAFKYSPENSCVSVLLDREGEQASLLVIDEGIGIPEDDREKVFERFYRADNARRMPGTGLGLSIVKYIIDAHKGTISLKRSSGGGTLAEIKLPLI